jgi:hypothetical protein
MTALKVQSPACLWLQQPLECHANARGDEVILIRPGACETVCCRKALMLLARADELIE